MKLFTSLLIVIVSTIPAYANTVTATVSSIQPIYHNTTVRTPTNVCQDVEVPVYGTVQGNGASSGDVLTGMIIGGLLGKGVSGNDKGAAAGAVLGGMISADNKKSKQVITGYRLERQCHTTYINETQRQLKHYKIWFTWNGIDGTAFTYNNYQIGDRIPVEVSLRAK
tara:strand:- start:534 stop:1034 length:501 start_codon:yes stop_codon:yes gene_type:complete